MTVAQGSKTVKKASAPKKSKTFIPSHPPYIQLITEALVGLKERTGSSHHAIAKHIEEEQKVRDLPPNFRKVLSIQLKRFVASGKLVKIKNSFKLPPGAAKTSPAADKPKPKPRAKEGAATKKDAAKPKAKTPTKKKEAAKSKGVSVKPKAKAVAAKPKPKAKKEKAEKPKSAPKKAAPAKEKKSKSVRSPVKKAPAAKRPRK